MFATNRRSHPIRGTIGENGRVLTQPSKKLFYCQLILSCYFLSGATPLLADQGFPTPSKSFHPRILNIIVLDNIDSLFYNMFECILPVKPLQIRLFGQCNMLCHHQRFVYELHSCFLLH